LVTAGSIGDWHSCFVLNTMGLFEPDPRPLWRNALAKAVTPITLALRRYGSTMIRMDLHSPAMGIGIVTNAP
jgi:hypothetical protein